MTDLFGTPDAPMIGGVIWNGSLHLTPPPGLSEVAELRWRLDYDLVWTMRHLIKIVDKDTNERIDFELNEPQSWAMWQLMDMLATGMPIRLWLLKGRQFGFSTLFMTVLFICASMRNMNSLIIANLEKVGQSIFDKATMAANELPKLTIETPNPDGTTSTNIIELVAKPDSETARTLMRWANENINAILRRDSAENRNAGVGETWQAVQLTEVPLWPDAEHTTSVLAPAMSNSPRSIQVGEFTARNEGDFAHKRWVYSLEPGRKYRSVFSAWYWYSKYRRTRRPSDGPLTPLELDYMATVASKGYEYPLTPQGTLIPRLHEKWSRGEQIVCSDLAVGYKLTDEHMLFLRDMLEEMSGDWAILNREFPYDWQVAFQTAGRKLIPSNVMDKLESKARDPLPGDQGRGEYVAHQTHGGRSVPRWQPRRDGRVHRFELPREKSTYLVWADPSSGAGEDPTGAGVYRIEHRKLILVASFEGYERPHSMARILARVGRHYRDGLILVPATKALKDGRPCEIGPERNGFGEHLIHELTQNLKYKRVCRYTDKGKDNWKGGHEYGFPTRKDTKMPMLQHLVAMAYDEQLEIPCRRVLTSLRGMQYLDDLDQTAGAPKGMHDDLAMGAGVGAYFAAMKPEFRFAQREEQPEWLRNRLAPEFDRSG